MTCKYVVTEKKTIASTRKYYRSTKNLFRRQMQSILRRTEQFNVHDHYAR